MTQQPTQPPAASRQMQFVRLNGIFRKQNLPNAQSVINATSGLNGKPVTTHRRRTAPTTSQPRAIYGARTTTGASASKTECPPNFHHRDVRARIHSYTFRSKHENALPLIVTHGWPGSVCRAVEIADRSSPIPQRMVRSASDAFDFSDSRDSRLRVSGTVEPASGWDGPTCARCLGRAYEAALVHDCGAGRRLSACRHNGCTQGAS